MCWRRQRDREERQVTTSKHPEDTSLIGDLMSWMLPEFIDTDLHVEEHREGALRIVRADLPDTDPENDLAVTFDGVVLRVRGRHWHDEGDGSGTHEHYGTFERVFSLPPGTTADQVRAEYADGVLELRFPATRSPVPREIPIGRG
jgi:HSP20 family protein